MTLPEKQIPYDSDKYSLVDLLDFDVFKPALLEIITKADTPLTLGVYGTWGTGKTSLLKMLEVEIEKKKPKMRPVWFTAWKYEQKESLWRAFILRVIDGLYPKEEDQRLAIDRLSDQQKTGVALLEKLEQSVYDDVIWQEKGGWKLDKWEFAKQGILLPIWLLFRLLTLESVAHDLGVKPDISKALERVIQTHQIHHLKAMEQFEKTFEDAARAILGKTGRLVVFIDDLDRCLPEKAIEILEAIKLFLDVPGTVFVLGMDREVIQQGIENHYRELFKTKELPDVSTFSGDLYLQKIIQIPFHLPPLDLDGRKKFIQKLKISIETEPDLNEVICEIFARGLFPIPRQVKRALNVYYLLKEIATERESREKDGKPFPEELKIAWPLLAKTVVIQSQYPELWKKWREYPTLIQTLEDYYSKNPVTDDEMVRGAERTGKTLAGSREDEQDAVTERRRSAQSSGISAEFITDRQKYALLAELLCYPDEAGEKQKQARFRGLSKQQLKSYFGLVGAVEQVPLTTGINLMAEQDWIPNLESGDAVMIREVLSTFDAREPDRDGTFNEMATKVLLKYSTNMNNDIEKRVTAAEILDERGYLPEDMYAFLPIPKDRTAQFHIGKYPVTNAQYARFLTSESFKDESLWDESPIFSELDERGQTTKLRNWEGGWEWLQQTLKEENNPENIIYPRWWTDARFGKQRPGAPVVGITWFEANAYCKWLQRAWATLEEGKVNNITPAELRLPTEPEWVMAAGGVTQENRFAWGTAEDTKEIIKRTNTEASNIGRTTPVWLYPGGASPEGVMDLSGNVWEWQQNFRDQEKYWMALRGGSWYGPPDTARVAGRGLFHPEGGDNDFGFRVVCPQTTPL